MELQELIDGALEVVEMADDHIHDTNERYVALEKAKMYLMGISDLLACLDYESESEEVDEVIGELEAKIINVTAIAPENLH